MLIRNIFNHDKNKQIMRKNILIALLGVCLVVACKDNNKHSSGEMVVHIDVTNAKNDTPDRFNSLFRYTHSIVLESNDSALIGKIGKIKLYEGNLYVLDSKTHKVLAFDSSGKYLRQYAHLGNGPKEYSRLGDFDIAGDTLYLLGSHAKELLKYDLAADTCYGSVEIEKAQGIYVMPDGGYALNLGLGRADGENRDKHESYAFYKHGKLSMRDIPFNKHLLGLSYQNGEGSNAFYTLADKVLTGFPFNDTLYTVSPTDGRLTPFVSIQTNDKHIDINTPKAEADKLRTELTNSIFAYYNWNGYHFFSYFHGNDPRTYVLASPEGKILFHGQFGMDSNRFTIRVVPYDTQEADKPLLSMIYPYDIIDLAKKHGDKSPLLQELASRVTAEGNPVLMFYDFILPNEP